MPEVEPQLLDKLIQLSEGDNATASVGDTRRFVLPYPQQGQAADPAALAMAQAFTQLCMSKSIRDKAPDNALMPARIAGYYDELAQDPKIARKLADLAARQNDDDDVSEIDKGIAVTEYLKEQLTAATGIPAASLDSTALGKAKRELGAWEAESFGELKETKAICGVLARTRPELFGGAAATAAKVRHQLELAKAADGNGWRMPRVAAFVAELSSKRELQARVIAGTTGLETAEKEVRADPKRPVEPERKPPDTERRHRS